jgi:hypothetical protein
MTSWSRQKLRARQIVDTDIERVIDLLARGFPRRNRAFWQRALDLLASHPTPEGFARYGYLMESDGAIVGVILLITTKVDGAGGPTIRRNASSWYVEPAFRSHAPPHTWPIVEAQGFARYGNGLFVAPALPSLRGGVRAKVVGVDAFPREGLSAYERDLLRDHARYGCMALWFESEGRAYPFVLGRRIAKRLVPCAQLIYCREVADVARFRKALGSYLARRGIVFLLVDANGPIAGMPGHYVADMKPKYFKGPDRPRLGDIAYTEAALFGV